MNHFLPYFQIVIAILLIISILLQQRGQSLGSAFGGSGSFYSTRRGIQKKILWATIILGFLFIATSLLSLII